MCKLQSHRRTCTSSRASLQTNKKKCFLQFWHKNISMDSYLELEYPPHLSPPGVHFLQLPRRITQKVVQSRGTSSSQLITASVNVWLIQVRDLQMKRFGEISCGTPSVSGFVDKKFKLGSRVMSGINLHYTVTITQLQCFISILIFNKINLLCRKEFTAILFRDARIIQGSNSWFSWLLQWRLFYF